jgi:2'-deoxynucleoside 5'-phosphate N-hydrolase
MNIFFIGSIRGGRALQPQYASIVKMLEKYGSVSEQHVSDDAMSEYGETNLPAAEILERELAALETCDIVVAEVGTPSLGVGYLLGRATSLGKRVIALYYGDDTLKLSAMVKGDPAIEVHLYKTDADVRNIFEEVLRVISE